MQRPRLVTILYILVVAVAALGLAAYTLSDVGRPPPRELAQALILTAMMALSLAFPIEFALKTKFSLHTSVVFAAALLFEPGLALLITGAGTLLHHLLQRRSWRQTLFNTAQIMLQAGFAGLVLRSGGWSFAALAFARPELILWILVAAAVIYFTEVTCVATVVALQQREALLPVWRRLVRLDPLELLSQFALGLLAAIVVDAYLWAVPLLLPPAIAVHRSSARQLQLRAQADAMQHKALHDPLTQLPNRRLFSDRLQHALARATRHPGSIAVLFLDLDRFKAVNDNLGHEIGDRLLLAVGRRLTECLRPEDTVARLGGDEFAVLLEHMTSLDDATSVAERIIQTLEVPFRLSGHEAKITTSIGITLTTSATQQPEDLLREADVAMYRAKANGKACFEVYDAQMSARALERLRLEEDLRQARDRHELKLYYLPMVDLSTGRIRCLEALVRWDHPKLGLLNPAQFLPLAEETGLIVPIDRWVLEEACRQMRLWQEQIVGGDGVCLAVNLSARQFQYGKLLEAITQVLEETRLDPGTLQLEISESTMLVDAEAARATIQELNSLGVQVAMDDFGTGYSSLGYLKQFPVQMLKIDKAFVEDLDQDSTVPAIIQAVNTVAQTLDIQVVAEGVETAEQLSQLERLGCRLIQGFYFSQPLSDEATGRLLARGACMIQIDGNGRQ